ncbi:MAG: ABC transporter permease [Acidobacteriota bacterium]|nr:ABC transporter permease [Acidobacteriota bacterium]
MLTAYLKLAWKVLLRRKIFTFISLFGISFTLMVLMVVTAMYGNINNNLKPDTRFERCLFIDRTRMDYREGRGQRSSPPGYKLINDYVRKMETPENVSAYTRGRETFAYQNGRKYAMNLKRTDGQYWEIMDFDFLEGGPFTRDNEERADMVAVINQAVRDQYFNGEDALGKQLKVDGQTFRVVGVVANVPEYRKTSYADVWVPIATMKSQHYRQELMSGFGAVILAKSSGDFKAIKDELEALLPTVQLPDPKKWHQFKALADTRFEMMVRGLTHSWDRDPGVAKIMMTAIGAILGFMLLPAVNLININMSRIMERSSEIGVRKAFGATSGNLTGQFLIENLILTLVGGLMGFAFSVGVLEIIENSGFIPYAQLGVDLKIFAAGLFLTVTFGVISGVYPAWRMSRPHPVVALKGGV